MLCLNRKHEVDKLQKLQNRALRLCFGVRNPRDISIKELHQAAKLSQLADRRNSHLLNIMYDVRQTDQYVSMPVVQTRQAAKIVFDTSIVHSNIYRNCPYYVGVNLWNNLTVDVQRSASKIDFKLKIKGI